MAAVGKRATIHDVARLAGVSIKTVSRVYNDEPNVREAIREKVKNAGSELRYRPNAAARNLVERRSHLIGLFFENPSASYVTELQMGALERLRDTRYRLLIFPVENREDIRGALIETAHASGLDGIIVTPPMSDDPEILAELTASAMPFARVAGDVNVHPTDSVTIDDQAAAADLMEYLLKLGHRRIAIVIGDPTHRSAELRLAGYRRALEEAGIKVILTMKFRVASVLPAVLRRERSCFRLTSRRQPFSRQTTTWRLPSCKSPMTTILRYLIS